MVVSYTQIALEICFGSMLIILERQAKDQFQEVGIRICPPPLLKKHQYSLCFQYSQKTLCLKETLPS